MRDVTLQPGLFLPGRFAGPRPINTPEYNRRRDNVALLLAQRLRRWPNIKLQVSRVRAVKQIASRSAFLIPENQIRFCSIFYHVYHDKFF